MKKTRYINVLAALALVLTALPLARAVRAESSSPGLTREMQYVPGEAVVGFQAGQDSSAYTAQASALATQVGAQVVKQSDDVALLSFAPDADVAAMVTRLSVQDGVAFAEPNYVAFAPDAIGGTAIPLTTIDYKTTSGGTLTLTARILRSMRTQRDVGGEIQSVPTYPNDSTNNWSWFKITTDVIWPDKSANPVVCVVDTGVDANHPDLKGYVINGQDYVDGDMVPADDNGHGTHVAGTIAARTNNGAATVAGISTAKILAVKVLNSQGIGTAFDISLGIRYCADHGAKVVNLSLGGYTPSVTEYNALYYAEATKGLVVVAAAGNDSKSAPFFPAAWARSQICKNGSPSPCGAPGTPNGPNQLYSGLISVAAARSLQTQDNGSTIWVDDDGNSTQDAGEDQEDCATSFSNYGNWVTMVAPGEDILSTTPVSYPFYINVYNGVPRSYAALSGTSMAAAHVSGAAARVWSVGASLPGTSPMRVKVKNQIKTWGIPLHLVQDPNWASPTQGYSGGGFAGDGPFCWPTSMSGARYLNVSAAMQRMRIGAVLLLDANTGLPLNGGTVTANLKGSSTILDTAIVPSTAPFVDLLNIPANGTKTYEVKVSKSGYTGGVLKIGEMVVNPSMSGSSYTGDNLSMAIPKNSGITVVATWFHKQAYVPIYGTGAKRDLDFYMWTPPGSSSTHTKGIVGPKETPWKSPGSQDMQNYTWFGYLLGHPYARSFFDGGSGNPSPLVPTAVGLEAINIKGLAITAAPLLRPYYAGNYIFILTDNDQDLFNNPSFPVFVRVWVKGKPFKTVKIPSSCGGNAWKALTINSTTYTLGSTSAACGDFSDTGLWPYR